MTLKVNLTEKGLFVNKYKCNSITIYETEKGFEGVMHNIEGITKHIPKLNSIGTQEKDFTGKLLYTTLRLKKKIKSKDFNYSGIALIDGSCRHAVNKKREYVNFYPMVKEVK